MAQTFKTNIVVDGNVTATEFYGDGSNLTGITPSGALLLTGGDVTGSVTITTGGVPLTLTSSQNTGLVVDGGTNSGIIADFKFGTRKAYINTSGVIYASSLFDIDDSNYYINPAGTSSLSSLNVGGPLTSGRLTLTNNVSTGGFTSFDDYQILLYKSSTGFTQSYGIGIEGDTMMFNSDTRYRFYVDNVVKATIESTGSLILTGSITASGYNNTNWDTAFGWGNHAGLYVRAYTTTTDNIDSDWGQSFKTFDPIPSGTPPIASPNIRTINVGNDYSRRTQLAFNYSSDQAWFRRRTDAGWYDWREFIHSGNIGSQSVNYAASAGNAGTLDGIDSTAFVKKYSAYSGGNHDMDVWSNVHATYSDNSNTSAWIIIQTSVPQDSYSMGGFELVFEEDYETASEGGTLKIYGYWNPESNGGFVGFKYTTDNPLLNPSIYVARNTTTGNTAFLIQGGNTSYAQIIARNLWLGYTASGVSSTWGDGWSIFEQADQSGYTNIDQLANASRSYFQPASTAITTSNISSQSVNYASSAGAVYGNQNGSFGLNDTKLYLRTNGDNNHYLWNAGDDWEELNAYEGTGLRITSVGGTTPILYIYGSSNGGYTYSPYSFRAPIFYDSNDTNYKVDPTSVSTLNAIDLNTAGTAKIRYMAAGEGTVNISAPFAHNPSYGAINIAMTDNDTGGVVIDNEGVTVYGAGDTGSIFRAIDEDVWQTNGNDVAAATTFTVRQGADAGTYTRGSQEASGDHRAPIFYDSNDTGYYLNPASTSLLHVVRLGANANQTFAQLNISQGIGGAVLYRDIDLKGSWSANEGHAITATHSSSSENIVGQMVFQHDSPGSRIKWGRLYHGGDQATYPMQLISNGSSAYLEMNTGEMRAPSFYDYNNTGYYVDPSSQSNVDDFRAAAYRGNANVGGTGTASWHPDGIYCGSTMWQYGTMYKNNTSIYDVSEIKLNGGPYLQTYNSRSLIIRAQDNTDCGISARRSDGSFAFQLYGEGTNYGFLGYEWGDWDIRKIPDGRMYLNNNNTYYLQTDSDNYVYRMVSATDMRAPIFYDSNDTTFFADYAGTSSFNGLVIRGDTNAQGAQNQIGFWAIVNGIPNTTSAIGFKQAAGTWAEHGATSGGYNTYFTMDTTNRGWVFRRATNGGSDYTGINVASISNTGNAQFDGSVRSPIFYDSNDTNYYIDQNSQSRINRLNISDAQPTAVNNAGGRLRISSYTNGESEINGNTHSIMLGPSSTRTGTGYYAGIAINGLMNYSGGPTYYDVAPHIWFGAQYRDTPGSERSDFVIAIKSGVGVSGTGTDIPQERFRIDYNGIASASGDMRAPVFYDSNNTGYYSDPAGTTYLNVIGAANRIYTGYDSGVGGSVSCSDWFRSSGNTGWYNATYAGGIYMVDSTWVRTYNDRPFYTASTLAAGGDVIAYYSDERLKTKISGIDNALDKICSLNGFYYVNNEIAKQNGFEKEDLQIGLSAQEVQKIAPEIVTLAPFDMETLEDGEIISKSGENYLTLNYAKLVPLLVEAIKEQQKQIDELKAIINGTSI